MPMKMGVLCVDPVNRKRTNWVIVETADGDEAVAMARSLEPGALVARVVPAADVPELAERLRGQEARAALEAASAPHEPAPAKPTAPSALEPEPEPQPVKRGPGRPRKNPQ